jgi:hypothetical protein
MEELGHLLGDELYQAWAYYSATIPQRKLADDLTRQFDGSGSGMTGEQRDRLIDIFHDNHVNYHPEILPISPATKSLMNTTFTRAQEQVMREAESVLSPQQMVVMKQYWSEIINQTQ